MPRLDVAQKLARAAFWAALLLVLILTLLPVEAMPAIPADKAQHFVGFLTLALLGFAGWGRRRQFILAGALAAFGGAIEILQATPLVGRDAELVDWIADVAGILVALLVSVGATRAQSES